MRRRGGGFLRNDDITCTMTKVHPTFHHVSTECICGMFHLSSRVCMVFHGKFQMKAFLLPGLRSGAAQYRKISFTPALETQSSLT